MQAHKILVNIQYSTYLITNRFYFMFTHEFFYIYNWTSYSTHTHIYNHRIHYINNNSTHNTWRQGQRHVFSFLHVLSIVKSPCKVRSSSLLALCLAFVSLSHCALDRTKIISMQTKGKNTSIYLHTYTFTLMYLSLPFPLYYQSVVQHVYVREDSQRHLFESSD